MKVLIIDDDNLVVSSLQTILESDSDIKVIATGNSGESAIELYNKYIPDILLMDIRMKGITGLETASIILEKYIDAKILFLTTFSDDEYIIKALQMGVKGYILKQNFSSIIPSVKAVYSEQTVFGNEIINKIPTLLHTTQTKIDLSVYNINEKELEIIIAISEGLSNKEISDKLYLSEGTVRNYISIILEKLNLRDRTQIAIFYYKNIG